jgi:REP element-mobilizing transposase RayT
LRIGRYSQANQVYLITLITLDRTRIFLDWLSARPVIDALKKANDEREATSLCWVIMPDHLHWMMELHVESLPKVVGRLKSRSTLNINRQFASAGRVWQKGFHDRAVRHEENFKGVARYIVANPLRAGLVRTVREYALWDSIWI